MQRLKFTSKVMYPEEKKALTMEQIATESNLLSTFSNQMADAVERVAPALVLVSGRQGRAASGVVYAQDLVLTADHVLEREEDFNIQTHDNRKLPPQFSGRDLATHLAVMRGANLCVQASAAASEHARVGA